MTVTVHIQRDRLGKIPAYAHPGDAGFDFQAAIDAPIRIWPGERKMIPTGLRMAIPDGYEVQVRSRSGLSYKHGVVVANAPGTLDSGFRGEVCVILQNLGDGPFPIEPGDRIAQGVLAPVMQAAFVEADTLGESQRGDGGFGSTGVAA
jgi:dUTP pyrophosphatase